MTVFAKDVFGGDAHTLGPLRPLPACGALPSALYRKPAHDARAGLRILCRRSGRIARRSPSPHSTGLALALPLPGALGAGLIAAQASIQTLVQTLGRRRQARPRHEPLHDGVPGHAAVWHSSLAGAVARYAGEATAFTLNACLCLAGLLVFLEERYPACASLRDPRTGSTSLRSRALERGMQTAGMRGNPSPKVRLFPARARSASSAARGSDASDAATVDHRRPSGPAPRESVRDHIGANNRCLIGVTVVGVGSAAPPRRVRVGPPPPPPQCSARGFAVRRGAPRHAAGRLAPASFPYLARQGAAQKVRCAGVRCVG